MAIYYFDTKIIKASSGKCAVASAAYQAGETLYDDRLGKSFSYTNKEEVVHTEILLPENAPEEYMSREKLWNAVEESQNKSNSRYARQFIIAVPNEWSREEAIDRCHEFIQQTFVDKGMAVDWEYHEKHSEDANKPDNHHIHIMATVRGFNQDGSWAQMEKKVYELDANGNKIPEIDKNTGEQKVRERNRDGRHTIEKIWKRITVQSNTWNSRAQLLEWRQAWSEYANQFLKSEEQIDHRSYVEQGIDKVAQVHEGYAARQISNRGDYSERIEMNERIKQVNSAFVKIRQWIEEAKQKLISIKERFLGRERYYEFGAGQAETGLNAGYDNINDRISGHNVSSSIGVGYSRQQPNASTATTESTARTDKSIEEAHNRISSLRDRISSLYEHNRAINSAIRTDESAAREYGRNSKIEERIEKETRRVKH